MLVRDVMSAPAIGVREETSIKDAIEQLDRNDIAAMPVLDEDGQLVGVVSEADLIGEMVVPDPRAHEVPVRLTKAPLGVRVADVMSTLPLTVTSDTDLARAADLMTSTAVKSLPVVDGGQVVGVVSRRDVIRLLARQDSRIEADVDELFRQAGLDWWVTVEDGIATVDGPAGDRERRLAETLVCTVPGAIGVRWVEVPVAD
ncbi:CBS domain-containing protein [Nocardioides sp. GXQ0305]|uniref:CBS domain-containing protein n=1 Tax=Nocardioides sp. GXQ0305 TaxID=3423912 RepID=UPI003D7D739F